MDKLIIDCETGKSTFVELSQDEIVDLEKRKSTGDTAIEHAQKERMRKDALVRKILSSQNLGDIDPDEFLDLIGR